MEKLSLGSGHLGRTRDIPVLPGAILVPNRDIPNGGDANVEQMGFKVFQVARLIQRGVSHDRNPTDIY